MSTPRRRSSSGSSPSAKRNEKAAASLAVSPQAPVQRPAPDDRDGWRAHWQAQGQPWRTEPEIELNRQKELEAHRAIVPDIEQGAYPFKVIKLSRADVEWLLATHEDGRGPIDWSDEVQRERNGIDVRGADLSEVDLSLLPLAKLRGGLTLQERLVTTRLQRVMAAVNLERANLSQAHLEGSILQNAQLKGAHLELAQLESAHCAGVHFEGAYLGKAALGNAFLRRTFFDVGTLLDDVSLGNEKIGFANFVDVNWGGVNLTTIQWAQMEQLGSERKARQKRTDQGQKKNALTHLREYETAVRATRQLAITLQSQGLNEDAARFAYRAQVLQKRVFWYQMLEPGTKMRQRVRTLGTWLFSGFLFLLAGYGYKPGRSFLAYLLALSGFATTYYFLGRTVGPPLSPLGAFVFSMTSFHGRGFFPGNNISLDDPLTVLAALEALVGLIVEVTFIATLTQRFFNR